jgi:hypothetical protein
MLVILRFFERLSPSEACQYVHYFLYTSLWPNHYDSAAFLISFDPLWFTSYYSMDWCIHILSSIVRVAVLHGFEFSSSWCSISDVVCFLLFSSYAVSISGLL